MKAILNYLDIDKNKPIVKVGVGDYVVAKRSLFDLTENKEYKVERVLNESIIFIKNDTGEIIDYPVECFVIKTIKLR